MIQKVNLLELKEPIVPTAKETFDQKSSPESSIDPITRQIFQNVTSTIDECQKLCQSSKYFIQLSKSDQEKLFDSAVYEIIIVSIQIMNLCLSNFQISVKNFFRLLKK